MLKQLLKLTVVALVSLGAYAEDLINNSFSQKIEGGWGTQPYWGGKMVFNQKEGCVNISSTLCRNEYWGRMFRVCDSKDYKGQTYEMVASVCGNGRAAVGTIVYVRGQDGKDIMNYIWGRPVQLTNAWQEVKCTIELSEEDAVYRLGPCVEVTGKNGEMKVRSVRIYEVPKARKAASSVVELNTLNKKLGNKTNVFFNQFSRDTENWMTQSYWGGKLTHEADGFVTLKATEHKGVSHGRMIRMVYDENGFFGKLYEFSAYVRGTGTVKLGTITYLKNNNGKNYNPYIWSKEFTLSDTWQKIVFYFDFSKISPEHLALAIEVGKQGTLNLDNVRFTQLSERGLKVTAASPLVVIREGSTASDLVFNVSNPSAPTTFLPASPLAYTADGKDIPNKNGVVTVPGNQAGSNGKVGVAANGVSAFTTIDVFPAADYDQFDSLARSIKRSAPLNVLIIGDSLLDKNFPLNNGIAAMDKLSFWLNKYAPGKVHIMNRAVRGDSIKRVWSRMNKERNTYALEVYDKMLETPTDLIFVMLGHNDTNTNNRSKFQAPAVSSEMQLKYYRLMLDRFRATWPKAKIVLVSSTCGNYALTDRMRKEQLAKNPKANVYLYNSPKLMQAFNQNVQELAKEYHADFYNIYDTMNALPQEQKDKIYSSRDGVHLTPYGQRYIALLYLQYFAQKSL